MNAISVRLDKAALRALEQLEAAGLTRSDAVRKALVDAAQAQRSRRSLALETAALEADDQDRQEMLNVAGFMDSLRASR